MKGVSAIIAVVLLLVITISMAGFFYMWMQGSLFTTQVSGTQQLEKTQESMSSCINFESASGNKIYVRNCGVGEIKNTTMSVYVDNVPVNYSLQGSIGERSVGEITLLSDIGSGTHSIRISGAGMSIDENVDICTFNCSSTTTSTTGATTTTTIGGTTTTVGGTTTTVPPTWLAGWSNRKPLSITNSTGSSLSDYPLKVIVQYTANMKNDFSDIRFADASASLLGYWIENLTSGVAATAWVKVPSIPVSGATIYMYYGKANASSESNGSKTFEFFDDFAGATIDANKWSETDTGGYVTQNERIIVTNGILSLTDPAFFSKDNFTRSSGNAFNEFRVSYKGMCQRGTYQELSYVGWKDNSAVVSYDHMPHAFYFHKYYSTGVLFKAIENGVEVGYGEWTCGVDYYIKLSLTSNGANYYTSTNGDSWSLFYTSTASSLTPLKIGFTHYEGGDTYFDNALVRKYVSPEPPYSFGAEQ